MNDFNPVLEYLSRYVILNEDEITKFTSFLKIKKVKKRQFIVQPDFVCPTL